MRTSIYFFAGQVEDVAGNPHTALRSFLLARRAMDDLLPHNQAALLMKVAQI
jgi:hypothetical protein